MAADTETLIFRIRAMAENLDAFAKTARASGQVNDSMKAAAKLSETLRKADQQLTVARDRQADAAGKVRVSEEKLAVARSRQSDAAAKVRVAEQRANDVRANTKATLAQVAAAEQRVAGARASSRASTAQVAAAEERLLSTRRNAARAGTDLQRVEEEFRRTATRALGDDAEVSGKNSGKRFGNGFVSWIRGEGKKTLGDSSEQVGDESGHRFTAGFLTRIRKETGNFESGSEIVGRSFGSGVGSGLETAMKTQAGPIIIGVLLAAVAIAAPAIGATLAGGIVTAFGAGITALAVVFALKAADVKAKWKDIIGQMGDDMQLLAKPFQAVMLHLADSMKSTFDKFSPILARIFENSAAPVRSFADQVLGALERLLPALEPISRAFNELLSALGPALQTGMTSLADGLTAVADSVTKSPNAFPDFIQGIMDLTKELLIIISILNDADGAFRRLTGGTSLVKVFFDVVKVGLDGIATPLVIMSVELQGLAALLGPVGDGFHHTAMTAEEAATTTKLWTQGLDAAQVAALTAKPPLQNVHDIAVANAKAAKDAAKAFDEWINQLFRLQNINMTVAQSQLALKQSITAATESLKANGRGFDLNTKAGQSNQSTLLAVAGAIQAQTEANIRAKQPMTTVARTAGEQRKSFIALAVQMGKTPAAAKAMADSLISIPNVNRRAVLRADKTDLDRKLAAAKSQLNDKNLTKERRAEINANIAKLTKALASAQAKIDALHGTVVEIKYTSNGVNLTTPSSVGRATGGPIRGPGGDVSDRAGLFALSNNEWVIRAKSSRKYGDYAMQSVNDGTAQIIPNGMAKGGPVVGIHTRNLFPSEKVGRQVLLDMMGGPALAFAKSQVGKPYVWGGVGPGGYDCSGFLSAITNVIQGRKPYSRRFATGSLPGGLFVPGRGRFEIGWFNGIPGHTAGTLNGTNVESRGGRGVVVGAGARGAGDHIFTSGIHHLKGYAKGGKVLGDPPYDGFKDWLSNLQSYAKGTSYVPHDGLAYLHRGERVTPASQNGAAVSLELKSDGSPYMEFLMREIRKYIRVNGGNVQKVLGPRG